MSGRQRSVLKRLAGANASLLGLAIALFLVALLGSQVKIADTEILAGTSPWRRMLLAAFALLITALALTVGVPPVRRLWSGGGFLGAEPRFNVRFVNRPELVAKITVALRAGSRAVALVGSSGAGKSVLAAHVCRSRRMRRRFPDGVTWLDASPGRDAVLLLTQLARRLGIVAPEFSSVDQARDILAAELNNRNLLIILDNVMTREPLMALSGLSSTCTLLLTTRNHELPRILDASVVPVGVLTPKQATELLTRWTTSIDSGMAKKVCERVGNWPLAVSMSGAMIAHGRTGADVIGLIDDDLSNIRGEVDFEYSPPTLWAAISVSIDELLTNSSKDRYIELTIFADSGPFPRAAAEALWRHSGISVPSAGGLLAEFVDRSLLTISDSGHYSAHDLQYEYLEFLIGKEGLKEAYGRILDGYSISDSTGSLRAAADPFVARNLIKYLWRAGRKDQMHALLADVRWMYERLTASGLRDLLADYLYATTPLTKAIHRALLLSASTLRMDSDQVVSQLSGRLLGHPNEDVHKWAVSLKSLDDRAWLAPIAPALISAAGPLEQQLSGHDYPVTSIAISADGSRGVSGDTDGKIRIWDFETSQELAVLNGHKGSIHSLAIDASGRIAISAGEDTTINVWDLDAGHSSARFPGQAGGPSAVAISADGRRGVSGGPDGYLRVWEVETSRKKAALFSHDGSVNAVALTANGARAISGGSDGTVRLWNLDTHELLACLSTDGSPIVCIDVTPEGHRAVSSAIDGRIRVWDLSTRQAIISFGKLAGRSRSISISADGRRIVSSDTSGFIQVWDCISRENLLCLAGPDQPASSVAATADGLHAAGGGNDCVVRVWSLDTGGDLIAFQGHEDMVHSVAVARDGQIGISGGADGAARVWEINSGNELFKLDGHTGRVHAVFITADAKHALTGGSDGSTRIWDLRTGRQVACLIGDAKPVWSVLMTPDQSRVFVGAADGSVNIWDGSDWTLLDTVRVSRRPILRLAATVDAGFLISGDEEGLAYGFTLESGKYKEVQIRRERTYDFGVVQGRRRRDFDFYNCVIEFTPDGRFMVVGDEEGTVRVINPLTREHISTVDGDGRRINAVTISVDGNRVAYGNEDGVVVIWDVPASKELARWYGDNPISACALIRGLVFRLAVGDASGAVYTLEMRGGDSDFQELPAL